MNKFFLIYWKEVVAGRLEMKVEIVKVDDIENALKRIKTLNAERRATTTEYGFFDLSTMFLDNELEINGKSSSLKIASPLFIIY